MTTNHLHALSTDMAGSVERVGRSVVQVHGARRYPAAGTVYADDLILTADHALQRDEPLVVRTDDGRTLDAELAGRDFSMDLAVLRVPTLGLPAVRAAGEPPKAGHLAMAVTQSLLGGRAATIGWISAVGGPLRTRRGPALERVIRFDATRYAGLSGAPLVNTRGEMIGILSSGLLRDTLLAIPSAAAQQAAQALATRGSIPRGYLGISSQPVKIPETQRAAGSHDSGLLVIGVTAGSPAERGGLLMGDLLVEFNGRRVSDPEDLLSELSGERVGHMVSAAVVRGGAPRTLQIMIGDRGRA